MYVRHQLHLLRAFPGSFTAKLTDAYSGYFAFRKRLHLITLEDHATYSPTIRHGPNKLLFNSATALHDIYDNNRIVKSRINSALMKHRRRIVGSAINEYPMRVFERAMIRQIDLFVTILLESSQSSQPVNITEVVTYLACFPLKLQTDPKYCFMVTGMFCVNHLANTRMQWHRLHQFGVFLFFNYFINDIRERYKRLLETMIRARLPEDKNIREDLFSVMADAMNRGEKIREAFAQDSKIRAGPQLANCRYLQSCICEALRITPPVKGTPWREVAADEKIKPLIVDDHVIPPETQVGIPISSNQNYDCGEPEDSDAPSIRTFLSRISLVRREINGLFRGQSGHCKTPVFRFELAPGELGKVGGDTPDHTDGGGVEVSTNYTTLLQDNMMESRTHITPKSLQ
ncbi:hypothetical protein RRF57_001037 [Xylaria bambusicola]|uniref:Uncharacterized protein n=1 Tax=Xylaria bambusicola TaxID=326684 RepID=A0AAN7UGS2_9PEZI